MNNIYFKFRNQFEFSPHPFDLGRPFFQNTNLEDNFFVLKIYQLDEVDYDPFYHYQEDHYLKDNVSQEEAFFKHVYDIVNNRIKYYKRQGPFSKEFRRGLEPTRKLEAFLAFLKTVDHWHKTEPIESVISEKNMLIDQLKKRITDLENQLKEANKYDAGEKIAINKGSLPAFMSLVHDLQELILPNENKLVRSQTQSPWYKMIAKYFMHGTKTFLSILPAITFPLKKVTNQRNLSR